MKKGFSILLAALMIIGLVGGILCTVQFIMALRYGELGRVVVYFTIAAICIELSVLSLIRFVGERKGNKEHS